MNFFQNEILGAKLTRHKPKPRSNVVQAH